MIMRRSLGGRVRKTKAIQHLCPHNFQVSISTSLCGFAKPPPELLGHGMEDFEGGMFGRRAVNLRRMTREPTYRNRRCLTVADRYWKAHAGTSRHTMTVERLQEIRVVKEDQVVVVRV